MRTLLIFTSLALSGCTGFAVAANAFGDLAQDAQLDALEKKAKHSEDERKALEAKLASLQARVDKLEEEASKDSAPQAATVCAPPSAATVVATLPVHDDYP
ncbi:MAG: hypothetical protein HOW73_13405 [Polyangiaceae bacterium]|nr:hypothetical protein [Polyangiaceae bacterium]